MVVSLELLGRGPARPDLLEDLVAEPDGLGDLLARWLDPVPEPAYPAPGPDGLPDPEEVEALLSAGRPVVLDPRAALPGPGAAPAVPGVTGRLADLVILAAHSPVGLGAGLVPVADLPGQVWGLLGAAVAAMTGGDVVGALGAPDPERLLGLGRSAREAVRDVVTAVVAGDGADGGAVALASSLRSAG